ncbi:hypothetical protein K3495_g423 [Podosphaera aphanis]|nr:hypothetical protein K3495_g423 [Podosphaera aphanis]
MHPYGCRAYALEHKIPRKLKMNPRAHIGYLVGYDSRNIYRIWIPSRKRVIRTRDVTFDHNAFWTPDDIDIGDVLRESAENVINTLDIPSENIPEQIEEDDLVDTIAFGYREDDCSVLEMNGPENRQLTTSASEGTGHGTQIQSRDKTVTNTHLPSPETTPEPPSDAFIVNEDQTLIRNFGDVQFESSGDVESQSAGAGSRAFQGINPENIVKGKRTRKIAHSVYQLTNLSGYHYAFSLAIRSSDKSRVHRNTLPPAPKSFRQIKKIISTLGNSCKHVTKR